VIRFRYYDDFSMWDTFRVVLPLLTIIQPERYTALMRSLVGKFRQGGWLPVFPCWNSYTNEMVGDHAIAILFDGISKGLFPETDGYSIREVFDAGWKNAMEVPSPAEAANGAGRRALAEYITHGYMPLEADTGKNQQVSISLEYAYDDYALSRLAARLNLTAEASALLHRSGSWRYLMDNSTGSFYVRGRFANGTFVTDFDPFAGAPGHGSPPSWITEDSPIEYTWFVPHDIGGLCALFGGAPAFVEKLRFFFDGGYYNAGNEPDIQVCVARALVWVRAYVRSLHHSCCLATGALHVCVRRCAVAHAKACFATD
jgi:predicted alpha-1,2-mannosidase